MMHERNSYLEDEDELDEGEEWITTIDFKTGQPKKSRKVKSI